jgi:hypothetical protein
MYPIILIHLTVYGFIFLIEYKDTKIIITQST